mmetsp:Transcript_18053/g.29914  ORF Transcript_18053/g.29914 Transcript_18053/m.29914 type:complete len:252 (+) Transcript_18053:94-849(+)
MAASFNVQHSSTLVDIRRPFFASGVSRVATHCLTLSKRIIVGLDLGFLHNGSAGGYDARVVGVKESGVNVIVKSSFDSVDHSPDGKISNTRGLDDTLASGFLNALLDMVGKLGQATSLPFLTPVLLRLWVRILRSCAHNLTASVHDFIYNQRFERIFRIETGQLGGVPRKGVGLAVGSVANLHCWNDPKRCTWLNLRPIFKMKAIVFEVNTSSVEHGTDVLGTARSVEISEFVGSGCHLVLKEEDTAVTTC